ncbi:uncharacterized protein LOC119403253 [Rhipicephalus sanguineus]|uniref:uncharacterized protein LOC119403253 n=1 Tax=Rhipicephalus sanguineus TaxID=34632 RepID=UPI0020C1F929|nr:uncharacterized protein LOC119403253 [Rhipicephalus sanguineus]
MVHSDIEEEDSSDDEQNDGFQERLIMSVALLTAVSLISATVMAVVQLLQLEERKPGAEARANATTDVSDWTLAAAASPWRPVHYDLLLHPSIKNNTYEGYVNAVFEIQHNARQASARVTNGLFFATVCANKNGGVGELVYVRGEDEQREAQNCGRTGEGGLRKRNSRFDSI